MVRRGLRQILADAFPDATFGEASSAEEAEAKINREPWSLVILDISMPGRNGLDALKALKPNQTARVGVERTLGRAVCLAYFEGWRFRLHDQRNRARFAGRSGQ